jgi:predicted MPP superfamily phosphohydrolase
MEWRRATARGEAGGGESHRLLCALKGVAAAGALALAYMTFEAQWVHCRQADLPVPGLPAPWSGLTILHLSDVHAGTFSVNQRSLAKVVRWAEPLAPDLVLLTGDILGDPERSKPCLDLMARLRPPLGMFAVTGNHEYGLSKAPLARSRDTIALWKYAEITLLSDQCVALPPREGTQMVLCGADYLSGGFGLLGDGTGSQAAGRTLDAGPPAGGGPVEIAAADFPILLIHDPPAADSSLAVKFPLTFAGHTHGGQLRVPAPTGLTPLHMKGDEYLSGIHTWGAGLLVVSGGIGTSFLPLRLFTRPEATLWRLVYTSPEHPAQADKST